jgi:hypothetical protein
MADNEQPAEQPAALDDRQHVAAVSVKMPEFWTDCPSRWFNRLESQFRLANVTRSSTKFDHTVAYLPVHVSMSVAHILDNVDPTAADSYDRLKAALCKGFTRSRWELAFELHSSPGLGDRKPTELMRHLMTLIPDGDTAGTWFMALFLMRLPMDMRDHIVAKDFNDCQEMAEYADKIHSGRKSKAISAVADSPAVLAVDSRHRSVSPKAGRNGTDRRRSPSRRDATRSQTPGPARDGGDLCWYHASWGKKANKCRSPCSWTGN